jgi:hypothetical protein
MMLPKVTHIHSSSKYSGVTGLLTRTARDYFAVADIVTWTEIEAEARERAIREASEEFFLVSGDRSYANDCGISLRKKRFKVLYTENFKSTNVNFYDKGGNKKDPQWATTAVVEDRLTQRRTVITVIHLASGIEGDMREGKRTKAIINWYASFRGAKKRANKLRKQYKAHAVLFIADFNLDFKAEWVRRAIKSVAPAIEPPGIISRSRVALMSTVLLTRPWCGVEWPVAHVCTPMTALATTVPTSRNYATPRT